MVPANTVLISPWWIWIAVIVAVAAAGIALVLFRRTRAQDATIRRQLAREVSLKARLDDLFERSSEIMVPGPHVSVAVSDTGVGMTPEVRERLFEPFFTTKGSGRGTGLGLSMALAIVRQAGGNITVESAAGGGSTFRLYFPRQADASAATVAPVASSVPATVKGEGVVLLAEDDRAVRRLVVAELGRRGFTVLEAEDGLSALDLFSREKDRIDVLVTDVVMPGVDPTGATNLLMKPFTADTLATCIKELIAGTNAVDARVG